MNNRVSMVAAQARWLAAKRSRLGAALLTALAAPLILVGVSRAEPRYPVHLEWTAPEGCPTASEIEAGVQDLLGAKPQASAISTGHAIAIKFPQYHLFIADLPPEAPADRDHEPSALRTDRLLWTTRMRGIIRRWRARCGLC